MKADNDDKANNVSPSLEQAGRSVLHAGKPSNHTLQLMSGAKASWRQL
jgi:hypothetical protein